MTVVWNCIKLERNDSSKPLTASNSLIMPCPHPLENYVQRLLFCSLVAKSSWARLLDTWIAIESCFGQAQIQIDFENLSLNYLINEINISY